MGDKMKILRVIFFLMVGFCIFSEAQAGQKVGKAESKAQRWIEVFRGEDLDAMDTAIQELAQIGEPAVPPLTKALKDPLPNVRSQSAAALGKIQPKDEETISALIRLLRDNDTNVRWNAAGALGSI